MRPSCRLCARRCHRDGRCETLCRGGAPDSEGRSCRYCSFCEGAKVVIVVYLSVEGGRSAEHDINQIVFPFLDSLLVRVPLWKLNNLCIRSIDSHIQRCVRLPLSGAISLVVSRQTLDTIPTLIGQHSCKLSLGGSRSTEVAAPPTESLDSPPVSAPSRLVFKRRLWQKMNI